MHFQAELANSLAQIMPVVAITSGAVSPAYYSPEVTRWVVNTGRGALGSVVQAANPLNWYRLRHQLAAGDVDLVHVVASHEWNPILLMLIKGMRMPLVCTLHDPVPHRGAPLAHRLSNKLMRAMADAVVVLSANGREQLLRSGFAPHRINLIPHGVYTVFSRSRRKEIKQENMILFFGRIEPYKGLDVLLAAFAGVREVLHGWRLVIAGSGNMSRYRAECESQGIEVLN